MTIPHQFSFDEVRQVLGGVLGADLHAKRIDSRDCLEIGGAGVEAVVSRLISDRR